MSSAIPAADDRAVTASNPNPAGTAASTYTADEFIVSAAGVSKRFKVKETGAFVQALDSIGIQVATGQLTAIVGPDGAGKTTFLRLVSGLMRPDAGTLRVLGTDVVRNPQFVQDRISYMPQKFGLYEDLSVQENLDLYADLHGVPREIRRQRFASLLEMTDLKRFTPRLAGKLSGGMKQKLGLACTLVRSPALLLLDEPTVGVDPLSRRELWEIVAQLRDQENLSVLLTTAYLDEAERCASVYVLHEGKLLSSGPPESTSEKARDLCYLITPLANEHPRDLQARLLDNPETVIDAVPEAGEVRVILHDKADLSHMQLNGHHLEAAQARLEDGFMVLLRAGSETADNVPAIAHPAPRHIPGNSDKAGNGIDNHNVVIDVRDLVRKFGDFTAVDSTTFNVKRGEIFGLLGPNGAGKTTTFRMLCGLLPATSGHAEVAGMDMRKARAEARQRIGYVSQKFALYGNLSVLENLRFFGRAYGLMRTRLADRIDAVLSQFDLQRYIKMPAGQLPGGVKQRLAMAVGLLHEPDVLFLDEPTSGTDPLARRGFWRRITALAGSGTTIVITTHFMEEAEYCDRIVIQDAGRLVAYGTPNEVRRQAAGTDRMTMEAAFIRIVEQGRSERENGRQVTA